MMNVLGSVMEESGGGRHRAPHLDERRQLIVITKLQGTRAASGHAGGSAIFLAILLHDPN